MKYLVMLTKVNKNKVIKNNKTGKEDYYDVLKFQPLEKKKMESMKVQIYYQKINGLSRIMKIIIK